MSDKDTAADTSSADLIGALYDASSKGEDLDAVEVPNGEGDTGEKADGAPEGDASAEAKAESDTEEAAGPEGEGSEAGDAAGDEDGSPPDDAPDAAVGDETGEEEVAGDESEESDATKLDAPEHWSSLHREMFGKLDAEAQQFMLERFHDMEKAHTQRSQEVAERGKQVEPLMQAMEQAKPYLEQIGVEPLAYFQQVAQVEYALRTGSNEQRIAILRNLAQQYGVTAPEEPDPNAPPPDPRLVRLEEGFGRIETALTQNQQQAQQAEQARQQDAQATQEAEAQAAQEAAIKAFTEEKDESGNLKHPYVAEVVPDMVRFAKVDQSEGKQPDLNDLYERAIWSNPKTRAKLQAAQQKAAAKERQTADQAKADKARKAASSISGAGSSASPKPTTDRRAVLEELMGG